MKLSEKISHYWRGIQGNLFPWLQEELGPLTGKQQQLITAPEFVRVEEFIPSHQGYVGRPEKARCAMARAFIAKATYNIGQISQLSERLLSDKNLRRICGWEKVSEIPSESTFSRIFSEFSSSALAARAHEKLILEYQSERLVGHISRDSTAIEAREKSLKKEVVPEIKKKRGRPKKDDVRPLPDPTQLEKQCHMTLKEMLSDLPTACDIGIKRNSKGYQESWRGYKLHLDTAPHFCCINLSIDA
jgi:transposase